MLPRRERYDELIIEVSYNGKGQGAIGERGSVVSWSGEGLRRKTIDRPSSGDWVISFNAQKLDASNSKLSVRIKSMDGDVLKEASTTCARAKPYSNSRIS